MGRPSPDPPILPHPAQHPTQALHAAVVSGRETQSHSCPLSRALGPCLMRFLQEKLWSRWGESQGAACTPSSPCVWEGVQRGLPLVGQRSISPILRKPGRWRGEGPGLRDGGAGPVHTMQGAAFQPGAEGSQSHCLGKKSSRARGQAARALGTPLSLSFAGDGVRAWQLPWEGRG